MQIMNYHFSGIALLEGYWLQNSSSFWIYTVSPDLSALVDKLCDLSFLYQGRVQDSLYLNYKHVAKISDEHVNNKIAI